MVALALAGSVCDGDTRVSRGEFLATLLADRAYCVLALKGSNLFVGLGTSEDINFVFVFFRIYVNL